MAIKDRTKNRRILSPAILDTKKWPAVKLPDDFPEEDRKVFDAKCRAVELYTLHGSAANIKEETGFSRSYASNMLYACLDPDEDGQVLGFKVLLECNRKPYVRINTDSIGAGSFKQFLNKHPDIKDGLEDAFYGNKGSRLSNNKISKEDYFDLFTILCTEAGIKDDEYPRNTIYCGKRSLYAYIDELRNTKAGISEHSSRNAKRHMELTGLRKGLSLATKPLKVCALDEHSVDATFCFYYEDNYGKVAEVELERFLFLPVFDENGGAVLGYSTTVREECNRRDIGRALKDAMQPGSKVIEKPVSIKTVLLTGPSIRNIPELRNITFEEIRVDNLKAHTAIDVKKCLKGLGIRLGYGKIAFPEGRAILERFFQTLEVLGFRQLPGTLGTGPTDPRRENSEKIARKYRCTYEEMLYCLEAAVQWYNRRGRHRNFFESPLQILRDFVNNPDNIIPRIPDVKLEQVRNLGITFFPTVRGSLKTGTRPYVQFLSGRYSNETLNDKPELIGQKIACYLREDARYADAFENSGASLGMLMDTSSWGESPMSFETRVLLLKKKGLLVHERVLSNDIRPGLLMNMELKGRKVPKRAARTALAIEQDKKVMIREAEEKAPPHRPPPKVTENERLPATLEHVGFVRK